MGRLVIFSALVVLASVCTSIFIFYLVQLPDLPDIKLEYWGSGNPVPDDKDIKAFRINIPDSELEFLKKKLNDTRAFVPPLEGVGFNYGFNTGYLSQIVDFWKNKYNWRQREAYLNSFPQFLTQIGGLKLHYIHVKPQPAKVKGKKVLPLLLLHGWPGSVVEFYEIIPLLTSPQADKDFVFEVIAPSLPGYGFSEAPSKRGMGIAYMGPVFDELMARLGFKQYYVQGGDWGSIIGNLMALLFPNRIIGYHSNACLAGTYSSFYRLILTYLFPSLLAEEGKEDVYKSLFSDLLLETSYLHLQATKPDTIGVALTDSPAGLAAYILEKFSVGTDLAFRDLPNGGLEKFDKAKLLDNVMFYWLNNCMTTSMRIYKETFNTEYFKMGLQRHPINVPTGCARFPNEVIPFMPKIVLEGTFTNLISVNDMKAGGHFAAFEEPKLLAEDIWEFVRKVESRLRKTKSNSK